MTNSDAVFILSHVEAHGIADEAKKLAIEALKAEPVKHGRWVDVWRGRWHACSVCEGVPLFNAKFEDALTPYCPHCGAKMDL